MINQTQKVFANKIRCLFREVGVDGKVKPERLSALGNTLMDYLHDSEIEESSSEVLLGAENLGRAMRPDSALFSTRWGVAHLSDINLIEARFRAIMILSIAAVESCDDREQLGGQLIGDYIEEKGLLPRHVEN